MQEHTLKIAKQWKWNKDRAAKLMADLKLYYLIKAPFQGSQADGLDWWQCLPIRGDEHPLKPFAIAILSIVPHSADVERFFSLLGGTQTLKCCNLSTKTFEALGKLHANYNYHLHQKRLAEGKSARRHHAHMHTCEVAGIDSSLAADLEANFTWTSPIDGPNITAGGDDMGNESYEDIMAEIEEAFKDVANDTERSEATVGDAVNGNEVLEGDVYSFTELDRIDKGLGPSGAVESTDIIGADEEEEAGGSWDIDDLMQVV